MVLKKRSIREKNILKKLGLEKNIVYDSSKIKNINDYNVDYTSVEKLINEEFNVINKYFEI